MDWDAIGTIGYLVDENAVLRSIALRGNSTMTPGSLLKKALMAIGALTLVLAITFYAVLYFQVSAGSREIGDEDSEYRTVVDWLDGTSAELVDSHILSGSWAGDHEKAFSVRFAGKDAQSLALRHGVVRGDQLTPTLDGAVKFVTDFLSGSKRTWFPTYDDVVSDRYYVYPMRLQLIGSYPDSAQILFIRPKDGMAFFAWVKI